jgi:hypothetical protein
MYLYPCISCGVIKSGLVGGLTCQMLLAWFDASSISSGNVPIYYLITKKVAPLSSVCNGERLP